MLLIADGGMSSLNTFDTMDAIMLTKNINYIDGVKLDVRKTRDNILVLSKYNELSKFTMSKKTISDSDYHYLRKVKFPSHIFKYYIPTLSEVLNRYNKEKVIVLEIYDDSNLNILCNILYNTLIKYPYKYYFISKSSNVLRVLRDYSFQNIGEIIDSNSNIKILNTIPKEKNLNSDNNILVISEYPEKNH